MWDQYCCENLERTGEEMKKFIVPFVIIVINVVIAYVVAYNHGYDNGFISGREIQNGCVLYGYNNETGLMNWIELDKNRKVIDDLSKYYGIGLVDMNDSRFLSFHRNLFDNRFRNLVGSNWQRVNMDNLEIGYLGTFNIAFDAHIVDGSILEISHVMISQPCKEGTNILLYSGCINMRQTCEDIVGAFRFESRPCNEYPMNIEVIDFSEKDGCVMCCK